MKIIVSSRYFYSVLSRIDSENTFVDSVSANPDGIIIHTEKMNFAVNCDVNDGAAFIDQRNVRWDFLKAHLCKVPDQPMVVNFSTQKIEITYTF